MNEVANGKVKNITKSKHQLLLDKIADPDISNSLISVLDKIDSIETTVSAMDEMMKKMPAVLESMQQQAKIQQQFSEGMALIEKITQPETMRSLTLLLDKLDTIDTAVNALDEVMNKAPQVLEDAQYSNLSPRLREGVNLIEKMTEPETLRSFTGLVSKIETAEMMMNTLDEAIKKAPQVIQDLENAPDIQKRLGEGLTLLEKVTDPNVLRSLQGMVEKIDSAELMINALDEGLKKFGAVAESAQNESHLGETIVSYLEIIEKLGRKEVVGNLNNLLDKIENLDAVLNILDGIMKKNPELAQPDSHTIETLSEMAQAVLDSLAKDKTLVHTLTGGLELVNEVNRILLSDKMQLIIEGLAKAIETKKDEVPRVGMFGAMKMVNNPDVQRAQGLLFTFLQSIGQKFDEFECKPDQNNQILLNN